MALTAGLLGLSPVKNNDLTDQTEDLDIENMLHQAKQKMATPIRLILIVVNKTIEPFKLMEALQPPFNECADHQPQLRELHWSAGVPAPQEFSYGRRRLSFRDPV